MISKNSKIKLEWHGLPESITPLGIHQLKMNFADKYGVSFESIEVEKKIIKPKTTHLVSLGDKIKTEIFDLNNQRALYLNFLSQMETDGVDEDDFFKMEKYISSQLKLKNLKRTRFSIESIDAKNILSYGELHKEFKDGFEIIQSNPQNGCGKSNIMNICKIGLFGEYRYPDNDSKTKLGEIFNDNTKDTIGFTNTIVNVNETRFLISRVFTKGKSITQTLNFLQLVPKEDADVFYDTNRNELILAKDHNRMREGYWGINLNQKPSTQTAIEEKIGSLADFYYSAILTTDNLNKWLTTKPTERFELFYNYFGLEIFTEKQEIAKKEYLDFKKRSKLGQISPEQITEENSKLELENQGIDSSLKILEESIAADERKINALDTQITQLNKSFYNLPDYMREFDELMELARVERLTKDIQDYKIEKLGIKIVPVTETKESLIQKRNKINTEIANIDTTDFDAQIASVTVEQVDPNLISQLNALNLEREKYANEYLVVKSSIGAIDTQLASIGDSMVCEHCQKVIYDTSVQKKTLEEQKTALEADLVKIGESGKLAKAKILTLENNISSIVKTNEATAEAKRKHIRVAKESHIEGIKAHLNMERDSIQSLLDTIEVNTIAQLRLTSIDTQISSSENKIEEINTKIVNFRESQKLIEENSQIESQVQQLEVEKQEIQGNIKEISITKSNLEVQKRTNLVLVGKNQLTLTELQADIHRDKMFQFFIRVHDKNEGISKHILLSYVTTINNTLNEVLRDTTDFEVKIVFLDRKIEFIFTQYGTEREVYRVSGYERFAASMAIHYTMMKLTTINIPTMIFMDEIFPSVGATNMVNVKRMVEKFTDIYDSIHLIAHDQKVIDWAIEEKYDFILITKPKGGHSRMTKLEAHEIQEYKKTISKDIEQKNKN